jgi:membrane-associated phospholipid phosphatase
VSQACRAAIRCLALLLLTAAVAVAQDAPDRATLLARAHVWLPGDVAARDVRTGPNEPGAFAPGETVRCEYLDKDFDGASLKFGCRLPGEDEVKVKFGGTNGEVYAEVAATRLLWALGFGADRMYPVRVICRGCPEQFGPPGDMPGERVVEPAAIERRMPGRQLRSGDAWSWAEIDSIDDRVGGAPRAQRDALKLLAVLMQHTDSKPEQQRLLCLDAACAQPFMMLNDVGLTFGRANLINANAVASVNLHEWAQSPIWKTADACVGNLPRSLSGTLKDPVISEDGRRFLARLLARLSDRQIRDLFAVAQVQRRPQPTAAGTVATPGVDAWVDAFKRKRDEIANHRCMAGWSAVAPAGFSVTPNVWLQSFASDGVTHAANVVSALGYMAVGVAFAVLLGFAINPRAGAALLVLLALTSLVANAAKVVVGFPRPDAVDARVIALTVARLGSSAIEEVPIVKLGSDPQGTGASEETGGFPSGHVATTAAFFLGLVFFFNWRWAWMPGVLAVTAMGWSRMYLGRHFLGDVIGGAGVAVIVAGIAVAGLTLARIQNVAKAPRVMRRLVLVAVGLAALALLIAMPAPYDAGRFLGFALGAALLVRLDDAATPVAPLARVRRVALASLFFVVAWWALIQVLPRLDLSAPVTALLRGAVPFALMLAGPLAAERLLGRQRPRPTFPA